MNSKIEITLFFLFGAVFFLVVGKLLINLLKKFHQKHNSKNYEKFSGVFKIFDVFNKLAAIFCLIYIIMVWTGMVSIPSQ